MEPSTVDLNALFKGLSFDAVEEAALAAGQKYSQVCLLLFLACSCVRLPCAPWSHACRVLTAGAVGLCAQINRLRWRAGKELSSGQEANAEDLPPREALSCQAGCRDDKLSVELRPMEIRTFLLVPVFGSLGHGGEGRAAMQAARH